MTSIPIKSDFLNENQKKAEGHLEAAALHHVKAVNHLKEGNYEKAAENAILAKEYLKLASDTTKEDIENYNSTKE